MPMHASMCASTDRHHHTHTCVLLHTKTDRLGKRTREASTDLFDNIRRLAAHHRTVTVSPC